MRNISLYLQDILDAMHAIEKFVEGIDFEEFKADDKTASAVIRKFEIIGEAAKQVPEDIRNKYNQLPWKEMAGMRTGSSTFTSASNMNWFGRLSEMLFPQ